MTKSVRIQLRRTKGWRMPENTVKVDRSTAWGNPFRVGDSVDRALVRRWGWKFKRPEHVCASAEEAVRRFRACLFLDEAIHDHVRAKLAGKNLACWCPLGSPCHADVLLELANA